MLAALTVACLLLYPQTRTIELSEGAPVTIAGKPARYWGVEDTYLDATDPDSNFGGSFSLLGGPKQTILIRFGDLERIVGRDRRVRRAALVLTPVEVGTPALRSASRVLSSWTEGPLSTLAAALRKEEAKQPSDAAAQAPRWSTTWNRRHAGELGAAWRQAGARAAEDAEPISGAELRPAEGAVSVEGLGPAVQTMIDRWYDNDGFALSFDQPIEFFSSQSPTGRPKLVLELEDSPKKSGPDLSVVSIDRTPEYPASGPKAWPADGEEVTYTAHVKNVGTAASAPFTAEWVESGRSGATIQVQKSLQPGEETTFQTRRSFRMVKGDHRLLPVGLRIHPAAGDETEANDFLEVQVDARPIDVAVPPEVASTLGIAPEDWVQQQVRAWNDVVSPQSRYSFAPEGSLERVRVQAIGVTILPADPGVDATIQLTSGDPDEFAQKLAISLGAPDLRLQTVKIGEGRIKLAGAPDIGATDRYPGLTGGGDTRNEATIPGQIPLPYVPAPEPLFETTTLESTGLLPMSAVGALNEGLGKRGLQGNEIYDFVPKTVVVRTLDLAGRPLPNVELQFYRSRDGFIPNGPPNFTVNSGSGGTTIVPSSGGHGPFGPVGIGGGDGLYLIRANSNGVADWTWMKAWQLVGTCLRGSVSAAVVNLWLNLPDQPLDAGTNLAANRIATDSADDFPAKLAAVNDGSLDTSVELPEKKGSWVELDLGRDRTIGEIDLATKSGALWPEFDIMVYSTGQRPQEATPWAKELDWPWTYANRREKEGNANVLTYRSAAQRVRFIRIVSRQEGPADIAEIRVIPAKIASGR